MLAGLPTWPKAKGYRLEGLDWLRVRSAELKRLCESGDLSDDKRDDAQNEITYISIVLNPFDEEYVGATLREGKVLVPDGEVSIAQVGNANLAEILLSIFRRHERQSVPDPVAQTALTFANSFGGLNKYGGWESLDQWAGLIRRLTGLQRFKPIVKDDYAVVAELELRMVHDAVLDRPVMHVSPTCMESAILVQMAQLVSSGARFATCANCNAPFAVGGSSGKRDDAKFCSDPCRTRFNNRRKLEAKAAAKKAPPRKKPSRRG